MIDSWEESVIKAITKPVRHYLVSDWGDDVAYLTSSSKESWAITTDALIEGTHFLRAKIAPEDLGYKSVAVNISDLVSKGAKPYGVLLSFGCPKDISLDWISRFGQGLAQACKLFGALVIGGDTVRSRHGLAITVTALGRSGKVRVPRFGAKAGDVIAVVGTLGDARAALQCQMKNMISEKKLSRALHRPQIFLNEGLWLARQKSVTAMTDLSDGLAADLKKILLPSKKGASIDIQTLPLSAAFRHALGSDQSALELAAAGGEEYGLLLTIRQRRFSFLYRAYCRRFGKAKPLSPVGQVTAGQGIRWFKDGQEQRRFIPRVWQH